MNTTTTRLALTIPEAAEACGVTDKAIRTAIHAGDLRAKRQSRTKDGDPTGKYLITVPALQNWLEDLPDA